jgi:thiol-disulfide isomerase/thioredoxin
LFVSPGDSLFIQFDQFFNSCPESELVNHLTFSGDHADINKTIFEYNNFKSKTHFNPDCNGKSVEQYKGELSDWIDNQKDILDQFVNQQKPSKEFISWATYDNIYSNANYLVDYMFYSISNKIPLKGDLFDNSIFPVDNDLALISRSYRFHLSQYIQAKYLRDSLVQEAINNKDYFSGYQQALALIEQNEKSGLSKDIMIYDLFEDCLRRDIKSCQRLIIESLSYISSGYLKTQIEKDFSQANNTPQPIEFISASNSKESVLTDLMDDIQSRFNGKVIYIDLWATWCGPCISEFPYMSKLAEMYKGKKIEFISICMNSSINNWQEVMGKFNLNSNQYFLDKAQTDVFSYKYQVSGFPTYFLINKKGQLIDKNAPRPSSPDIKDKIDKLLER